MYMPVISFTWWVPRNTVQADIHRPTRLFMNELNWLISFIYFFLMSYASPVWIHY